MSLGNGSKVPDPVAQGDWQLRPLSGDRLANCNDRVWGAKPPFRYAPIPVIPTRFHLPESCR